jgi:hypothetical protein
MLGIREVYLYTLCIVFVDMLKSRFYDIISKKCETFISSLQIHLGNSIYNEFKSIHIHPMIWQPTPVHTVRVGTMNRQGKWPQT